MEGQCGVAWCTKAVVAKGLCSRHYDQQRKYGRPENGWNEFRCRKAKGHIGKAGYLKAKFFYGGRYYVALVHREVMRQHLGRDLRSDEYVGHKDGNILNNDLSNLELWVPSPPWASGREAMRNWATDILARYGHE